MLLRSLNDMIGYKIKAKDGEVGKINDFYFDDGDWAVRYAVDKTGFWLLGRHILISPSSFEKPDWDNRIFPVSLTKDQVRKSESISADLPISKEEEKKLVAYFQWPAYWVNVPPQSSANMRTYQYQGAVFNRDIVIDENEEGTSLRSTNEVIGYKITSEKNTIGYVEDFIVDDEIWAIRYMVIDTKKLLPGKKVVIAPEWINLIGWREKEVSVDMDKEKIKACPAFDVSLPISREYEEAIYDYYECDKYWENRKKQK